MPMRNRFNRSIQMKFEISEIEHEIKQMQVDLEYSQKQGLLIRQAIEEKEGRMDELIRRLERLESIESRVGGETEDGV